MPGPVAVTGATGFIGTALLAGLTDRGLHVHALTRRTQAERPGIRWIRGDLDDERALVELAGECATIIHCAGRVRGRSAAEFDTTNAGGTARLLAAIGRRQPPPRLLLMSSLAAREPQLSWYATSKRRAEELLGEHSAVLRWTVFRPTAVYGPGDRELRPLLNALRFGWLPMAGSREQRFGLLHVQDLVAAVLCWIDAPTTEPGPFELDDGTPGGYNRDSLRATAQEALGRRVRIVPLPIPMLACIARLNLLSSRILGHAPMLTPGKLRELTHPNWVCDNGLAQAVLKWRPQIRLADALRDRAHLLDGKH